MKKRIIVLGASGSIGQQSIELIKEHQDIFDLVGVSVGTNLESLDILLEQFPSIKAFYAIKKVNYPNRKSYSKVDGIEALLKNVEHDIVLNALVGSVGFLPSVTALELNKTLLLANKESLVMGGFILKDLLKRGKGKLIPIDSEHTGVLKCLSNKRKKEIDEIVLTASGGAFRNLSKKEVRNKKAKEALKHPTWKMGAKITIDSATMMNKAFEVIEAYYLFNLPPSKIKVVLHEESIIHALVKFTDQSILSEMSTPDMKRPILYALMDEKIEPYAGQMLDFNHGLTLNFKKMDTLRFPYLTLAYRVLNEELLLGTVLNVSNDYLVSLYLEDKIPYYLMEQLLLETFETFAARLKKKPMEHYVESIIELQGQVLSYLKRIVRVGGK